MTSRTVCSTYWTVEERRGEEKGGGEEREGEGEGEELAQEMEEMWKELTALGLEVH